MATSSSKLASLNLIFEFLFSKGAWQSMVIRQAAWYRKDCATFSDTIALVHRSLWHSENLWISEKPPDMIKIPRPLFDCLIDTLGYAA
jgi:hypothetical protein